MTIRRLENNNNKTHITPDFIRKQLCQFHDTKTDIKQAERMLNTYKTRGFISVDGAKAIYNEVVDARAQALIKAEERENNKTKPLEKQPSSKNEQREISIEEINAKVKRCQMLNAELKKLDRVSSDQGRVINDIVEDLETIYGNSRPATGSIEDQALDIEESAAFKLEDLDLLTGLVAKRTSGDETMISQVYIRLAKSDSLALSELANTLGKENFIQMVKDQLANNNKISLEQGELEVRNKKPTPPSRVAPKHA